MPTVSRRNATLPRWVSTSASIGDHVHIGRDCIEQHALAGIAERLAPGQHLEFRDPDALAVLKPLNRFWVTVTPIVHGFNVAV